MTVRLSVSAALRAFSRGLCAVYGSRLASFQAFVGPLCTVDYGCLADCFAERLIKRLDCWLEYGFASEVRRNQLLLLSGYQLFKLRQKGKLVGMTGLRWDACFSFVKGWDLAVQVSRRLTWSFSLSEVEIVSRLSGLTQVVCGIGRKEALFCRGVKRELRVVTQARQNCIDCNWLLHDLQFYRFTKWFDHGSNVGWGDLPFHYAVVESRREVVKAL